MNKVLFITFLLSLSLFTLQAQAETSHTDLSSYTFDSAGLMPPEGSPPVSIFILPYTESEVVIQVECVDGSICYEVHTYWLTVDKDTLLGLDKKVIHHLGILLTEAEFHELKGHEKDSSRNLDLLVGGGILFFVLIIGILLYLSYKQKRSVL